MIVSDRKFVPFHALPQASHGALGWFILLGVFLEKSLLLLQLPFGFLQSVLGHVQVDACGSEPGHCTRKPPPRLLKQHFGVAHPARKFLCHFIWESWYGFAEVKSRLWLKRGSDFWVAAA